MGKLRPTEKIVWLACGVGCLGKAPRTKILNKNVLSSRTWQMLWEVGQGGIMISIVRPQNFTMEERDGEYMDYKQG